jgi:hypothetical protein
MCTSPHAVLNDFRAGALAAALWLVWSGIAAADQASDKQTQARSTAGGADGNGPSAPDVMTRDALGHAVVRATRLAEPLQLDGRLDEAVFQTVPPLSDFIQQVPDEGKPATEKTEVWVLYDANNIYLAAKCWDSAPESEWIANDYRRDSFQMKQNDTFGLSFDTFYDHRNGFVFYTNPLGARVDYAVVDETTNFDWNPVWDARPGRFEGGWTVEIAIPFKSLRYLKGEGQRWGMQLRRVIRRKNEWAYLARVPRWAEGPNGLTRVQYAATLVGLELPGDTTNIEVKPYVVARTDSDYLRTPAIRNDPDGDFGVDAKYGITPNLTADFTYNTDFAQVEVDEQQVNLTRFSIQFPEKRDFFLEGKGLFDFARGGGGNSTSIVPTVFFSRRIGLENGRVVPVLFGSRLTGKMGRLGIGALNIQTREDEAARAESTNFTVIRVKSDVLRRSSVGAIFTNRTPLAPPARPGEERPDGSNQAYGADANFAFFDSWYVSGYYAKNNTPGQDEDSASYQAKSNYNADRYGLILDYLVVGQNFNPEIGFVQRRDFKRTYGSARFSPRPESIDWVRKFTFEGGVDYIVNGSEQLETRLQFGRFASEFENSDILTIEPHNTYELLAEPFEVSRGVIIPPGSYEFNDLVVTYLVGAQRRANGQLSLLVGEFYDGTITSFTISSARVGVTPRFSFEPGGAITHVELPYGSFTANLFRLRTDYAFSARMFASAFLQYNQADRRFSSNVRFRWEYKPGSEFFVVYTDERDTRPGLRGLQNRAFVVKVNRLFRF